MLRVISSSPGDLQPVFSAIGDDGLGCKVLHQCDLLVGEGSYFWTVNCVNADRHIFLEHRDGQQSSSATNVSQFSELR